MVAVLTSHTNPDRQTCVNALVGYCMEAKQRSVMYRADGHGATPHLVCSIPPPNADVKNYLFGNYSWGMQPLGEVKLRTDASMDRCVLGSRLLYEGPIRGGIPRDTKRDRQRRD